MITVFLCTLSSAAIADCTLSGSSICNGVSCAGQTRPEGTIIYNNDYDVMQYCAGTVWKVLRVVDNNGSGQAVSLSAGGAGSCITTATGRAWCWGVNGQVVLTGSAASSLGLNTAGTDTSYFSAVAVPIEVYGGLTTWSGIKNGYVHSCGIAGGRAYCWGEAGQGSLGRGSTADSPIPVEVSGSLTDWASIDVGASVNWGSASYMAFTCGRRTNGRLYCWGNNSQGQLGDTTTAQKNAPTEVSGAATDWAQVSTGGGHACAVKTDGRLYCWGDNTTYGQLGDGTTTDQTSPTEVSGAATDWAQVSAGVWHTCALKTTGRLYCWGRNTNGQIGNTNTTDQTAGPVEVTGAATDWAYVTAGLMTTCALKTNGRAYCWGRGNFGQRGNNSSTTNASSPVEVNGGHTDWTAISTSLGSYEAGFYSSHTCGIRSGGTVWCWGLVTIGISGDGYSWSLDESNGRYLTPHQVLSVYQ